MSYQAIIDDGPSTQVASNGGWYGFCDWVRTLDEEAIPELAHLADHGWEEDLEGLAEQLEEAVGAGEPSADVAAIATGLLKFLMANKDVEVIVVTQGI